MASNLSCHARLVVCTRIRFDSFLSRIPPHNGRRQFNHATNDVSSSILALCVVYHVPDCLVLGPELDPVFLPSCSPGCVLGCMERPGGCVPRWDRSSVHLLGGPGPVGRMWTHMCVSQTTMATKELRLKTFHGFGGKRRRSVWQAACPEGERKTVYAIGTHVVVRRETGQRGEKACINFLEGHTGTVRCKLPSQRV